ncbi:hypothetical protein C5B42_00090 [Candidatus Cerribacteria bacterium 'Amazon FNV 2010 28 9']|uniref:Uncharacterized protein n=1 Tax=Candidatus Cerribacteria bacterium 'Amazon FNV 2010 28 9' TaxID=2081795 RepID=A0A317JQQ1_9BACT|nr:MAG: hypothetical protein C5B42_00090 [Candidatus Cerribacteria bacterium 'Amazon FNV 2010 28 9']
MKFAVAAATFTIAVSLFASAALASDSPAFVYPTSSATVSDPIPTSTPAPSITHDNLQEFTQNQQKQIQAYLQQMKAQLQQKTQQIKQQRLACEQQIKALQTSRVSQRKDLLAQCKPPTFNREPTSTDEAQARTQQLKQFTANCKAQLKQFDIETKQQVQSIQVSCFNNERTVLGLSTMIPSVTP